MYSPPAYPTLTLEHLLNHRPVWTVALMAVLFCYSPLSAQEHLPVLLQAEATMPDKYYYMNSTERDFQHIQEVMGEYYSAHERGRGSGYKQWKRWEYNNRTRLNADGEVMNYGAVIQKRADVLRRPSVSLRRGDASGQWQFIGPSSFPTGPTLYGHGIGRIDEVAFHPTDPDILFVGAPNGGLWKTTDRGSSWACLTDEMPTLAISGIAIDPTDPDRIFINTGDADTNSDRSRGVYMTTDGGLNWQPTDLTYDGTSNARGGKIIMDPSDTDVLLAIQGFDGVYRTDNGGESWSKTHSETLLYDIEYHPTDPDTVYVSGFNSVHRSVNGGLSWTSIAGLPASMLRVEIAVTPAAPDQVLLLTSSPTGPGAFEGVYRSLDAGSTFEQRGTSPNIFSPGLDGTDEGSPSATLHLGFASKPSNSAVCVSGNFILWRSTDGAGSYQRVSNGYHDPGDARSPDYVHVDVHGMEYNPLDDRLYCANDGGLYVSENDGDTWTPITDGLTTTMFYDIDGYDPEPSRIIGGTQDNGNMLLAGGSQEIIALYTGDGTASVIDPTNPEIMYYSAQDGNLQKTVDGGASHDQIHPPTGPFIFSLALNPLAPQKLYGGYDPLERSNDGGENWWITDMPCAVGLDICRADTSVVYTLTSGGVYVSENGGIDHDDITGSLPIGSFTDIKVDPFDPDIAFLTSGFFFGTSAVYRTTDRGASWDDITGDLPDIPVNCVAIDGRDDGVSGKVYVGTDIGIYYRDDEQTEWLAYDNGLPMLRVEDIEINELHGLVTIGTYGRGLWQAPTYSTSCTPLVLEVASQDCLEENDESLPTITFTFQIDGNCTADSLIIDFSSGRVSYDLAADQISDADGYTVNAIDGEDFTAYFFIGVEPSVSVSGMVFGCMKCNNPFAINFDPTAPSDESLCLYDYDICDCQGVSHTAGSRIWHNDGVLDDGTYVWNGVPIDFNCATWGFDCEIGEPTPADDPHDTCNGNLPPNNGCGLLTCPGDINGDLVVDVQDFIGFNSVFGSTCSGCAADLNEDGEVNVGDFLIFNSNFGSNCQPDIVPTDTGSDSNSPDSGGER